MMRPIAAVRVLPLPDLAQGAVRVEVECPEATTGYTWAPALGGLNLPVTMLVTMATYTHEEKCGACDTAEAHAQGDQRARGYVERMWRAMQAERARRHAAGRRN
jgi:hypothetical protein